MAAMEANLAAFWMGYGHTSAGDAYADAHLMRFSSVLRHPLFNAAFGGFFASDDAALRDQAVRETTAYFQTRQRPAMWWIGPTAQSPALSDTLKRNNWHHLGDVPGMVLDLNTLDPAATPAPDLSIKRVQEIDSLHAWTDILGPANDIAPAMMPLLHQLEEARGFADDNYVRYLARFNGQAVAASAVLYSDGVAGIFAVATDAKMRGRGFGRAVTAAPLIDAKQRGYRFSVLQASELGYPVYKHLGFEHRWMVNLFAHQ